MTSIQFIELATLYAPSVNDLVSTACFAIKISILAHYSIIKPTRR